MKYKKSIPYKLLFINQENVILGEYDITSLPLSEKSIIAGSIKFYCDPEPCMIHRGAVMSRYYTEFFCWIEKSGNKGCILPLKAMPDMLIGYLAPWVFKEAAKFQIVEGPVQK